MVRTRLSSPSRVDGVDKVTGAARYAADIARPGMLWAKVLRSPVPHARILGIDARRARALPGVHAVLTAQDIPAYRIGRSMRDMPVLARYVLSRCGVRLGRRLGAAGQAQRDPPTEKRDRAHVHG